MAANGNEGQHAQKPAVKSWYSGGKNFKVTHYTYAVENDPFYTSAKQTELVEVPELDNRKFTRGFLGIDKNGKVLPRSKNAGVTMQGTGLTNQGDYITYTNSKGGKANFRFGVGGRFSGVSRPFEQIAVDPKVIPKGSKVYVEKYGRVMSADDIGSAIKGNHIDVFVGPKTHKEAVILGDKWSRIGKVGKNVATGGADIPTQAKTPASSPALKAPAKKAQPQNTAAHDSVNIPKNGCVHIVGPNESLASIAADHKVQGGYRALAAYNGIANPRLIHVGQEIVIPPVGNVAASAPRPEIAPNPQAVAQAGFFEHAVAKGETLASIAKKYHVVGGYRAIVNANNLRNPNSLTIGQKLRIPSAKAHR